MTRYLPPPRFWCLLPYQDHPRLQAITTSIPQQRETLWEVVPEGFLLPVLALADATAGGKPRSAAHRRAYSSPAGRMPPLLTGPGMRRNRTPSMAPSPGRCKPCCRVTCPPDATRPPGLARAPPRRTPERVDTFSWVVLPGLSLPFGKWSEYHTPSTTRLTLAWLPDDSTTERKIVGPDGTPSRRMGKPMVPAETTPGKIRTCDIDVWEG
jgi:hypothetical protein